MRLEPRLRPLGEDGRRRLEERAAAFRREARKGPRGAVEVAALATAVLWTLTLVVSDAPWTVVTVFWIAAGTLLALWARREQASASRDLLGAAATLESALARGEAEAYDIAAERYVELEEVEDEGACWAFQLDGGRVVFLTGQEMYAGPGFPSLDFSLVYPLDGRGRAVDLWIETRGPPVPPARVIPAAVKMRLIDRIPDHLEVVRADLDRLEETLW